ncbi:DUF6542 domain-containing protein [Streptomyces aurantiogriseus]|uniref:Membrane protein n=1 Tax=Streptomyces aurantiogriseus TaxID=66870 RepID=A0A918C1S6_9ACTN|nr:DUF6542 domain-containing protein [Streptomyces aurantiogriseus]GGR02469.1 membrane protein [Streptomyces aurantiogriseus]
MEHHRTRLPQNGTRRGTPPLPPQADRGRAGGGGEGAGRNRGPGSGTPPKARHPSALPRPARAPGARTPPPPPAVRRPPNPRLTGLGGGLFSVALMLALGWLDQLLFGASPTVYSVLFLPVCLLTALWVRRAELFSAPVVAPIAFAVGLVPVADSGNGLGSHLMGLFTALATQAGWLYAGTLLAGVVALVRRVRVAIRTRRRRGRAGVRRWPSGPPDPPWL